MSVYFVTGATGYIGSMLIRHLLETRIALNFFRQIFATAAL